MAVYTSHRRRTARHRAPTLWQQFVAWFLQHAGYEE